MARAVLAPGSPAELLVAHAERLVAAGRNPAGETVVVKVNRDLDAHRREAGVLGLAATGGARVPAVLSVAEIADPVAGVLVLEWVPGEPVGQAGLDEEHFGDESWAAVGEELARLHACPVPTPGPPMGGHPEPSFAAHIRAWGAVNHHHGRQHGWLTAAEAHRHDELVEDLAARVSVRPEVLIHGDCSPQHWLVEEAGTRVRPIDLGDAGLGDPAYDLVVLTLTHPHHRPVVLDGYGADDDLRGHLAASSAGYRALRLAGEMRWLIDHDFDPSPTVPRLRAALA